MAKLRITRDFSLQDMLQPMKLYVNGRLSGQVRNNTTHEFSIPTGTITIQLKWDVFGEADGDPQTFHNVQDSDVIRLRCYPQQWNFMSNKIIVHEDTEL